MRPAVLIVEPDRERRRILSRGLAQRGYEAVPAISPEEGLKFARGLGPSVIVAPAALLGFGDAAILERFQVRDRAMKRTLLLLGDPADEAEIPADVLFLPIRGLTYEEINRRIRLVLVGREVGVDADAALTTLVGELSLVPLLELVRALHRCMVSGRLELEGGSITLERGEVIAAEAGRVRGVKAFCRLSRRLDGPFRIRLHAAGPFSGKRTGDPPSAQWAPSGEKREIDLGVPELVLSAIEDLQVELSDPRAEIRILAPPGEEPSSHLQQTLLEVIEGARTVSALLDALPATDGRVVQMLRTLQERGWVRLEIPRVAVAVVTDSTSDLPPELARQHEILVVPLSVVFGRESFRDGVDIRPRDFYQLLETSDVHPHTQPPPEAEFYEHFLTLIEQQDVVAVHISAKMSETFAHARAAALRGMRSFDHVPPERHDFALEVVDSHTVSMGVGLMALFAARMAQRELKVFQIAQRLRAMATRIHILFAVDTFDYLVRGGRIGKARAAVGKLLGIRPILGVEDGEVTAIDRVRGGRRVHPRIVELLAQRVDPRRPIVASIAHARAPVWADRLRSLVEERFEVEEMILTDIGPVVGTHAGPGCVGCVAFQPEEDEWPLVGALE